MTYTGVSSVSSNCMTPSPLTGSSWMFVCWSWCCWRSLAVASSGLGLAQQLIPRVVTGGHLAEGLERLACLAVDVAGHLHVHGDQEIAHRGVGAPDSLAPDPERAAVRGTRRDPHAHRHPAVRRHLDLRAERGLGERDRHGDGQVVAGPAEHGV